MDELSVREALRTYVSDGGPPPPMDAAGLVAAGRRGRRLRLTAVAASVAVVAVIGAVTAVTALSPRQGPWQPAASAPPPTQPAPLVEACPAGPPTRLPKGPRLTCHLRNAVHRLAPGATLSERPHLPGSTFDIRGRTPLEAIPRRNEGPGQSLTEEQMFTAGPDDGVTSVTFNAEAVLTDQRGSGTVFFLVGEATPGQRDDAVEACNGWMAQFCEVRTGPVGATIVVSSPPSQRPGVVGHTVSVYSGHTLVSGSVTNAVLQTREDADPDRPEPPLSLDALIEITTMPELLAFG